MRPLTDLRQLLRIAEQQQVSRCRSDRDGVCQAELPGLLDDQHVEAAPVDTVGIGEVPGGAADHAAVAVGDERCELSGPELAPRPLSRSIRSAIRSSEAEK